MLNQLFHKSLGFVKTRPSGLFQELKYIKKIYKRKKKCDTTKTFLVKKKEQKIFSMRTGIHNISSYVYVSILIMHEKLLQTEFALVIDKCWVDYFG